MLYPSGSDRNEPQLRAQASRSGRLSGQKGEVGLSPCGDGVRGARTSAMRKTRVLVATGLGIWIGWRARDSMGSLASFRGVGRRESTREYGGGAAHVDPGEMIEKARALAVLGRERGKDLLRLVLSGRRAA